MSNIVCAQNKHKTMSKLHELVNDDAVIQIIMQRRAKRRHACVSQATKHLVEGGHIKLQSRKGNRKRSRLRTDWNTLNAFWTDKEFTLAYRINRSDFALLLQRLGRVNPRYWNPNRVQKLQAIRSSGMYITKEHRLAAVLRLRLHTVLLDCFLFV